MILGIVVKILFSVFSIVIALSDIKTGAVPRIAFVFAFPVLFVLCMLSGNPHSVIVMLSGALPGLAVFLIAFVISGKKLGLADVWYSALAGLVLGVKYWYAAVTAACVAAAIWILVLKRGRIPFIPFLALGSISMLIFQGWPR